MKAFEDYYKILQLHHSAESEVIEGAYKKLAKKYHPDINHEQSASEKMKMINVAYEELSDPTKRQAYDRQWQAAQPKNNSATGPDYRSAGPGYRSAGPNYGSATSGYENKYNKGFTEAKSALDAYFRNIQNNRFDSSYNLATNVDKQNITCDDFIRWQRAVASVFLLKEYRSQAERSHKNKLLNGQIVQEIVEFSVDVVEYNVVMDRMERDSFIKKVVLEKDGWHVHIGHEKLQPLISRFKELNDILVAKNVLEEFSDRYSRQDAQTGLSNNKGLTEEIEKEIQRFGRYGHAFSLMKIEVDIKKSIYKDIHPETYEFAMKSVSEKLTKSLRKTDILGRWDDHIFMALLPETKGRDAELAKKKILEKLNHHSFAYNGKFFISTANISVAEYKTSLKDTLSRLHA